MKRLEGNRSKRLTEILKTLEQVSTDWKNAPVTTSRRFSCDIQMKETE